MAKRKIRLNKLSQYTKESDRLVLETYSAGCGGIVLRWRDPQGGTPVRFSFGCSFDVKLFLDEKPIRYGAILKPGEHVLAIRCTETERTRHRLIGMQLMFNYPDSGQEPIEGFNSNTSWVCRGISRATEAEQAGTPKWTTLIYDDSDWSRMNTGSVPDEEQGTWMFRRILDLGGQLLVMPNSKEVLIRYRFTWEREQ